MRIYLLIRSSLVWRIFNLLLLLLLTCFCLRMNVTYMTDSASFIFTSSQHPDTASDVSVLTYHNDNLRTGQYLNETVLNTRNVNAHHFGKRVSYPVDGQIYAQPLFVPGVPMKGHHYNVVYVATENDSVYALDADQMHVVAPLWKRSFLHLPVVAPVPSVDVFTKYPHQDIQPSIGITSTPVIDLATNTMYVVAMTKEHSSQYVQRLHALDITTGTDRPGSPVTISALIKGQGYDSSNGRPPLISFDTRQANQRPALLLLNNVVYIAWGGFGDSDPYHGWLLGYSYNGRAFRLAGVFNTTPDGQEGGIWMSGAGPAADSQGNIYLTTANGTFDLAQPGQRDAGDSFVKLSTQHGIVLSDYFTPFNQHCLDGRDEDLGAGGVLLLPDQPDAVHPHVLIGVGKEGRIYLLNRDHLGQFHSYPGSLQCGSQEEARTTIDQVMQELPASSTEGFFGIPAYWLGTAASGQLVYIGEAGDHLKSFHLSRGTLSARVTAETAETFGYPGAIPSISSNRSDPGTGIVWTIAPASCDGPGCAPQGTGVLHAYDATNLRIELYNSQQNIVRDGLDSYVKFSVPTIANGRVFVGTQTTLNIFGLLP